MTYLKHSNSVLFNAASSFRGRAFLGVEGIMERGGGVTNPLAERIAAIQEPVPATQ
jgi:hypothetical protein